MSSIVELSAVQLADAVASGEISASDALDAYLEAIEKIEPQVDAYNEVPDDHARTTAANIDAARTGAPQECTKTSPV